MAYLLVRRHAQAIAGTLTFGAPAGPPVFPRERVIERALEAARSSAPEIGIQEARVDAVTAELLSRDEVDRRRGPGTLGRQVAQVWWVEARGYFRYEGMPVPGAKPPVYEADERVFLYDAATGQPVGGLIPHSRLAGASPTPASAAPTISSAAPGGAASVSARASTPLLRTRIALERGGDIFVLKTATRNELRLTDDGRNRAPHWSSDGKSLFFTKSPPPPLRDHQPASVPVHETTWRWRSDSGVQQVAHGVWSPDANAVATSEGVQDVDQTDVVWLEHDGRRTQITPTEPRFRWRPLAWSPDGRRLALARHQPGPPMPKDGGSYNPATVWISEGDPSAGVRRQLQMPPTYRGQARAPDAASWSPDGRFLILYVGPAMPCASCRADGLPFYAVPVDGGAPIELGSALWATGAPTWAPDGAFAVLSVPSGRETYVEKHLVRVEPAGAARTTLAQDPKYVDLEPAVSPDGRLVAFARGWAQVNGVPQGPVAPDLHPNVATIASRHVWVVGADGSNAHQLLAEPGWTDEAPVWSADGASCGGGRQESDRQATAELWAVQRDGTTPKRLGRPRERDRFRLRLLWRVSLA